MSKPPQKVGTTPTNLCIVVGRVPQTCATTAAQASSNQPTQINSSKSDKDKAISKGDAPKATADTAQASNTVMVRPPYQIELGILGFRDLGRDYEVGFWRGVVLKGEIGHVRRHMTKGMTSEDYTSQA